MRYIEKFKVPGDLFVLSGDFCPPVGRNREGKRSSLRFKQRLIVQGELR